MKPLTRADREFLLLGGAFLVYGVMALVVSVVLGGDVGVVVGVAAVSTPVFALAAAALAPRQTEQFLEQASLAPASAPKESARGQVARFALLSLVLAAPLAAGALVALVLLFERVGEPFGAVVQGLAVGMFVGFGIGYLRLWLWMRGWQARTGKLIWREASGRRRTRVPPAETRKWSPLVRYYVTGAS